MYPFSVHVEHEGVALSHLILRVVQDWHALSWRLNDWE